MTNPDHHMEKSGDQLSAAKKRLLAQRLKGRKGRFADPTAFPSQNSRAIHPKPAETVNVASFAQERLWFLQQLHPESAAYNMHGVVRIRGPLNVDDLESSINRVIARHSILRSTFALQEHQIVQHIQPELQISIGQTDLTHLPVASRESAAKADSVDEARQPFDLQNGPLIRASLLHLEAEDAMLRLTLHHIISDEWSTGLFWQEIAHFYGNTHAHLEPPHLPIQYADYAHWQRQQLAASDSSSGDSSSDDSSSDDSSSGDSSSGDSSSGDSSSGDSSSDDSSHQPSNDQLDYWRNQLSGHLPVLELPTDRQRPAIQSQDGALLSRQLPVEVGTALRALSRQQSTTLFHTMLAAFNVLLYRYTNETDLLVGTPVANRNNPSVANLIGFFVNSLVIRTNLKAIEENGDPTFSTLLDEVRDTTLHALANQDLPFERLVEELQPERDQNRNPLFQVMCVHQTNQTQQVKLPGLTLEQIRIDSRVAKFDLTLFVNESRDDLSIAIEYSTDLFDQPTIERMLGHFETLLNGIAKNPERPISQLPLLTKHEERLILGEWSGVSQRSPSAEQHRGKLIHHLFEEHAQKRPDAPAIAFADEILTYGQLNQQSDALANQLQNLGIGPNIFVAICAERSLEMLIAILGVLKAGGAYVPLDPAYPHERLAHMLTDTAAPIILTQPWLVDILPETNATVLTYISQSQSWMPNTEQRLLKTECRTLTDDPLAYVIYTSGSTGTPKGVQISHANLVHSTAVRFDAYPRPVDRFLLLSSFAFDSSIVGIFWTLCQGGTLVLAKQGEEKEVQSLAQLISRHQVTHLLALPSLYQLLIDYAQRHMLTTLKTAIVAGEACPAELVSRHFAALPDTALYNEYGPTEGPVWSTFSRLTLGEAEKASVSIGRPIPQVQTYILDPNRNPLPIGIPGELVIAGDGISSGYLNQPELTDERFPPVSQSQLKLAQTHVSQDESALQPSQNRQYQTGDLVKWRADGAIEFIGRIDQQVKIRGVRIELGEIEAALLANDGIQDAVVDVIQNGGLGDQLVAFITKKNGNSPIFDERTSRSALQKRLPATMIPTRILAVDKLPRTPNGKVDRSRLGVLFQEMLTEINVDSHRALGGLEDELEIQLTNIWESVLQVRPVGIHDNYFDLGGHSLQAVHLFEQIRARFGKDMPLASLFQTPTVHQQAALLRRQGWTPDWSVLVPIQPRGSRPPLFCAHAVGGNVLSLHALGQHLGMDQPFYAFQSQGLDGKETVPQQVEEMAAYYISEMRTVQPYGPYQIAGQSSGGLVAFEIARQLRAAGEEIALLGLIDTYLPAAVLSKGNQQVQSAVQPSSDAVEGSKMSFASGIASGFESGFSGASIQQQSAGPPSIPLRKRLQFHLQRIKQKGLHHVTESARSRAIKIWLRTRRAVENRFVQIVHRYYERSDRPLPPRLRPIYVRTAVEKAILNYRPSMYHGDIVLFRATASIDAYLSNVYGSQDGWSQFTDGEVTVVEIEGGHNLEQEPAVGILASKLGEHLG